MKPYLYFWLFSTIDIFILVLYSFYLEVVQRSLDGTWEDL